EVGSRATVIGALPCHGSGDETGAWRRTPYFNVAFAHSFSGWAIRDDVRPQTLKDLLTIDGGEADHRFDLWPEKHMGPGVGVLWGAEAVSVAFAIIRRARIAGRLLRESRKG